LVLQTEVLQLPLIISALSNTIPLPFYYFGNLRRWFFLVQGEVQSGKKNKVRLVAIFPIVKAQVASAIRSRGRSASRFPAVYAVMRRKVGNEWRRVECFIKFPFLLLWPH